MSVKGKSEVHVQAGPCAFVFQNPDNQIVMPTVASEVALGTGAQKLTNEEVCDRVYAALDKVNMTDFAEASTGTLSGGQKQRTAIAAALAQGPPAPQVCDAWRSPSVAMLESRRVLSSEWAKQASVCVVQFDISPLLTGRPTAGSRI
jgi:ABC-type thiamine transport system ATPase subunit